MAQVTYEEILEKARAVQAKNVMPLIGGLLDAWDGVPNDTKGLLRDQSPALCEYLEKIEDGMCADIGDDQSPK